MPGAARLNDSVTGTTAGEHSGHSPPHSPETFSGEISAGSSTVFINGRPAARIGDALAPHSGSGEISSGSGDVLIGG